LINNRQQNGRRRGRGGGQQRPQGNNGGGQRDSGNRIDSRARGNATQLHEKYRNMARDAQMQGDRVNTEYYLQFADHYFRVMSDQRGRYDEQAPRRTQNEFDGDDDFGFEGDPVRNDEQQRAAEDGREDGRRDDAQRDHGNRDGGNRDGQRDEYRRDARQDGNRQDNGRQDNGRQDEPRRERSSRDERPRNGNGSGYSETQPRRDRQDGRRDAAEAQPHANGEAEPRPAPVASNDFVANGTPEAVSAEPRKRPRARKPRPEAIEEAGESAAFDAAILPPSIATVAAPSSDDAPAEPKPRRRRTPRAAESEVTQAS